MKNRKLFMMSLLSCIALTMQAERLYIEDFGISPGETKTMSICLENELTYVGFQFNMILPEGLSISVDSPKSYLTERTQNQTSFSIGQNGNKYTFLAFAFPLTDITGNNGAILNLEVTASEDMVVGSNHIIEFTEITFQTEDDAVMWEVASLEQTVTIVEASEEPVVDPNRLYIDNFEIEAGVILDYSKEVSVKFSSEYQIKGVSGELVLVDGLRVDEYIAVSSMYKPSSSITVDGNIATFSVSSTRALSVYEGELFTLYFYTTDDFAGTHTVEFRNLKFIDASGEEHNLSNSTFTVTGPEIVDNEVEFTLQNSYYNNVVFYEEKGAVKKIKIITTDPIFLLNAVVFNGKNVTEEVVDGIYTTPALMEDAVLNISFSIPTAEDTPSVNSRIKAYGYRGDVVVTGCERGESIAVYDVDGVLLRTMYATGNVMRIAMPTDAIYVVKAADAAVKVAL